MSRAQSTTIDPYGEFQAPRPPIEGGGVEPGRTRRPEVNPYEEGYRRGRSRTTITANLLVNHLKRWQAALLDRLSIIKGEIKELEERVSPGMIFTLIFALLFGAAGFLVAIAVDYYIVRDFWNAVFANEYGEVPASAGLSPLAKALQVVVAALMFHFLYQALGRTGKRIFIYVMGVLAVILLLGVGVWVANDNLPPNFSMFGVQLTEETEVRDTTLTDLGLAPAEPEQAPADSAAETRNTEGKALVSNALGVLWFAAFGMIFIVVTGVAALSLGVASRAAAGLFGSIDREYSDGRALNRQDARFRLVRARKAEANLENPDYRKMLLEASLADFQQGYLDAMGRLSEERERDLREAFSQAEDEALAQVDTSDWSWVSDHERDYSLEEDGRGSRRRGRTRDKLNGGRDPAENVDLSQDIRTEEDDRPGGRPN